MHLLYTRFKHFGRLLRSCTIFLLAVILSTLINSACGKRKPPLPPIERIGQRVEIDGFQRGPQVRLSWIMPARNAPAGSTNAIVKADIYRLAETTNSPLPLTEEEFANRANLIASLPINASDFGGKSISYFDTLKFAGQNIRLRYAIRFVNESGQKAGFSNFLLIEPTGKVAAPPSLLSSRLSQDEINLAWAIPKSNIDGSNAESILGFNIYRAGGNEATAKLLNQSPVALESFADKNFEFEIDYKYFVRAVSLGPNAEPIESEESNIIEIRPKDTFPPLAPASLTIAATPNSISIFFVANQERDIAGYRVFRSLDQMDWKNLTEELLTTNTFQDTNIEKGKTYFYYLTAIDKFGNESKRSEIISETIQ